MGWDRAFHGTVGQLSRLRRAARVHDPGPRPAIREPLGNYCASRPDERTCRPDQAAAKGGGAIGDATYINGMGVAMVRGASGLLAAWTGCYTVSSAC
jgi:hypothetical protein